MNKTEKQVLVDELTNKIKGAKALYYTDFTGLNVKRMTELRRRFRKAGVEYAGEQDTVAKADNPFAVLSKLQGPKKKGKS